jgi:hypothetical protein
MPSFESAEVIDAFSRFLALEGVHGARSRLHGEQTGKKGVLFSG